jgi:hypothetical protein
MANKAGNQINQLSCLHLRICGQKQSESNVVDQNSPNGELSKIKLDPMYIPYRSLNAFAKEIDHLTVQLDDAKAKIFWMACGTWVT